MPLEFRGAARPLDGDGVNEITDLLGVGAAEMWAVLSVETRGCGFLPDRRPMILFERHIFRRETKHRYDQKYPDLSHPKWGGYGAGGAHQYERLGRALKLDRTAALRSASWGIGQLMGFNAKTAGFTDVEQMVAAMAESENQQLLGAARLIIHNGLDRPLRSHDWAAFARGYNGRDYRKNQYDTRLAAAYRKYAQGLLPDLVVRAAQIYLTYLGYSPGPIDGVMGRFTRSALQEFLARQKLPSRDEVDQKALAALAGAVKKRP